jgi:tetratricopeptide (TPR) repeat protein
MKRFSLLSRNSLLVCAILLVTAVALFPTLRNEFTNFDDDVLVTGNAMITQLTPGSVREIFTSFSSGLYHPLVLLSYAVEFKFFKLDPLAYHCTNLLLHLLNCVLVFWLFKRVAGNKWVAFIVALLFGIHPMHVESVAWIAERKDVLYAAFYLAALIAYDYYATGNRRRFYYAALVLFVCSLLSKPMAMTLPVILILMDFLRGRKFSSVAIMDKLPFFLGAVLFAVVAVAAQYTVQPPDLSSSFPFIERTLAASYGFLFYLQKLVFPVKLAAIYPDFVPQLPWAYAYPAAVLALGAAVALTVRRTRKILFGALFFLAAIFPTLQFLPNGWGIPADRYTYLPSLGLFYLFAEGAVWLARRGIFNKKLYRGAFISAFVVLIAVFSAASWQRSLVWHDSVSMYTDVIYKYPDNYYAWHNRGQAYFLQDEYDLALDDYNTAIMLKEDFGLAYNNRGAVYYYLDQYDKALEDYHRCIDREPTNVLPYLNISDIHRDREAFDEALFYIHQAELIDPNDPSVYSHRASVYEKQGKTDEAIGEYSTALRLDPYYQVALSARGRLYEDSEAYSEAMEDFTKMIQVSPKDAESYFHLGNIFSALQNYPAAEACYRTTLLLQSDYPDALDKMNEVHQFNTPGNAAQ